MTKQLFIGAVVFCAIALPGGAETTPAKVIGQRVNLRAKPDLNSEVVGQVSNGDTLLVKSQQDAWVEVRPPESVDLWVSRDLVTDNKIAVSKANIRAGPGINYGIVGRLERGQSVEVRGSFGEWVRIAPFDEASLWVSAEFLELKRPAAVEPPSIPTSPQPVALPSDLARAAASPTNVPPPVSAPPADTPAPPAGLDLIPLEGQGQAVEMTGELKPAPYLFSRPSPYRLARKDGSAYTTVCYLRGNTAQLESLRGKHLRIKGRQYWVQGTREPVVAIESIVILRDPVAR